jgi:hypothetical protein
MAVVTEQRSMRQQIQDQIIRLRSLSGAAMPSTVHNAILSAEQWLAEGTRYSNQDFDILQRLTCVELDLADRDFRFYIGQRVRFRGSFCNPPYTGRVQSIHRNDLGTIIYALADGGLFSADELQPA